MEWTKVTVATVNEAVEAIANILTEAGAEGIQIEDASINDTLVGDVAAVSAFFPETVFVPEKLPLIRQRVLQLTEFGLSIGEGSVNLQQVADDDWATAWKKYYQPTRLTRFLTVVPSWTDYQPTDEREALIRMDPGMAFGTGTHPTTHLSVQMLEMVLRGGEQLIDVGTGSGVLSIAAAHLGVQDIRAYDVDQVAVDAAVANFDLNPVTQGIIVKPNDLLHGITGAADVIVANMLPVVLVPLIPQVPALLKEGGHLLLAGIITEKEAVIRETLSANGLMVEESLHMGDWVGLITRLKTDED
ncbi:50S ribosomal protein L11 methyltransferase [Latilactobacillus sakei]|uniref:50S ribosomal protein L11 methyltransferase n=1 Tax=Latilactobacillus sakei TaxID=1599 RepID=UPI000C132C5C|nr:50S ribosomal protein L11 methyltransferase [Latilactobacillus sakei]SOB37377.1 ribosomal protein L11 methyltransferase [Latilactobacillus sakei]